MNEVIASKVKVASLTYAPL